MTHYTGRLLKNGVERRCERRGAGCQAPDEGDGAVHREERQRRRRLRAAATACGGRPFAREASKPISDFLTPALSASRDAKGQTRRPRPFFSSLLARGGTARLARLAQRVERDAPAGARGAGPLRPRDPEISPAVLPARELEAPRQHD